MGNASGLSDWPVAALVGLKVVERPRISLVHRIYDRDSNYANVKHIKDELEKLLSTRTKGRVVVHKGNYTVVIS